MNENLIALLALKATRDKGWLDRQLFAELIVRECVKVAIFKDNSIIAPADVAGYMAAGRSTAAQMIKEHFGVE